jgi:hypothetical protein
MSPAFVEEVVGLEPPSAVGGTAPPPPAVVPDTETAVAGAEDTGSSVTFIVR